MRAFGPPRTDCHGSVSHCKIVAYGRSRATGELGDRRWSVAGRRVCLRRVGGGGIELSIDLMEVCRRRIGWQRCRKVDEGKRGQRVFPDRDIILVFLRNQGLDERLPPGRSSVRLHVIDGQKLEVTMRLACSAVLAGVEEGEESPLLGSVFSPCFQTCVRKGYVVLFQEICLWFVLPSG